LLMACGTPRWSLMASAFTCQTMTAAVCLQVAELTVAGGHAALVAEPLFDVRRALVLAGRLHILPRSWVLATSLFGDVAAALREHGSATLDEHCCYFAALTESWPAVTATCAVAVTRSAR
jgi:hypothetical protein